MQNFHGEINLFDFFTEFSYQAVQGPFKISVFLNTFSMKIYFVVG